MPQLIQRVPLGLGNALNTFGGLHPTTVADHVQSTLDLLQFYGLNQLQVKFANNAAIAPATPFDLDLTPSDRWGVLFGLSCDLTMTATITKVQSLVGYIRGANASLIGQRFYESVSHGLNQLHANYWQPPGGALVIPPGSKLRALFYFATDATANVGVSAEVGIFG